MGEDQHHKKTKEESVLKYKRAIKRCLGFYFKANVKIRTIKPLSKNMLSIGLKRGDKGVLLSQKAINLFPKVILDRWTQLSQEKPEQNLMLVIFYKENVPYLCSIPKYMLKY